MHVRLLVMVHGFGGKRHGPNIFFGINRPHANLAITRAARPSHPGDIITALVALIFHSDGFARDLELANSAEPSAGLAHVQSLNRNGKWLAFVVKSVNTRRKFLFDSRRSPFSHAGRNSNPKPFNRTMGL